MVSSTSVPEAARPRTASQTSRRLAGSSPVVGSSSSSSRGAADQARAEVQPAALAARVGAAAAVGDLAQAELVDHRGSGPPAARPGCPNSRAVSSRFSRPVIVGSTAANWPASPMSRRTPSGPRPRRGPAPAVRRRRPDQRRDRTDERRLAGPVRPEYGQHLARRRDQVQPVQRRAPCRTARQGARLQQRGGPLAAEAAPSAVLSLSSRLQLVVT